jgi:hypothetical protein
MQGPFINNSDTKQQRHIAASNVYVKTGRDSRLWIWVLDAFWKSEGPKPNPKPKAKGRNRTAKSHVAPYTQLESREIERK